MDRKNNGMKYTSFFAKFKRLDKTKAPNTKKAKYKK